MSDTPIYPNWFDGQRHNFESQLQRFRGKPELRFLQIGVFTGDASVWLCENILTDPTSILIDVDTWAGSAEPEHDNLDFDNVLKYYEARITPYRKVVRLKMTSDDYFASKIQATFHFAYIDGDHTSAQVERDAHSAWALLKPGGILAFDDYLWGQDLKPEMTPKPAIDNFLKFYEGDYEMLADNYQVWIAKK